MKHLKKNVEPSFCAVACAWLHFIQSLEEKKGFMLIYNVLMVLNDTKSKSHNIRHNDVCL